jgi:hypothetical protein
MTNCVATFVARADIGSTLITDNTMEGNPYVTAGELALWGNRTNNGGDCYQHYYKRHNGATATGIALGSAGLAVAIFGGLAIAYGLNSASKARARGSEMAINQQAQTMSLLAQTINREAVRTDGVTIDVNQNLRSLASQTATANALAQGGSSQANALATAEALALINQQNGSNPLSSVIDNCCSLRVQRVSTRNCGCDSCGG